MKQALSVTALLGGCFLSPCVAETGFQDIKVLSCEYWLRALMANKETVFVVVGIIIVLAILRMIVHR